MKLLTLFSIMHLLAAVITHEDTLKQVHIVFRHGNRTPIIFAPTDPYKNATIYWPEGLGELTKKGQETEYNLGAWLRKRYDNFTKSTFDEREVHVLSTDLDRTLMSAQCVLASYFYPPEADRIARSVPWIPAPVHNVNEETDTIINVDHTCPRIEKEWENVLRSDKMTSFLNERKELFKKLSNFTGQNLQSSMEVGLLYDTLLVEKLNNLSHPEWVSQYWNEMEEVAAFSFKMNTYSTELKRLRSGPMLNTMTSHMKTKNQNGTTKKMFMYSAHDFVIANLLNTMGAFNDKPPPYGSAQIVEFHTINGTGYTKLFYHNETTRESPYPLSIEGCDHLCPLEKWEELLSSKMPTNWTTECERPSMINFEYEELKQEWNYMRISVIIAVMTFVAATLVLLYLCLSRKSRSSLLPIYVHAPNYGSLPSMGGYSYI